ncbi:MAG TPA: PH domain-containing protein [Streptosporangiaceae bacterium]
MTAPNERTRTDVPVTVGRLQPDGSRIYRLTAPVVVWWMWVALVVLILGDLLIQGRDYLSLKFALGTITATGLVFACTYWPQVRADEGGVTVRNPFRVFRIPWAAVRGIFLADSLEIQCTRSGEKKDKTVYCWALSSTRRTRARAKLHGWQWEQGRRSRPSSYGQLPGQAKELVKMTQTEVIAREMAAKSDEVKARLLDPDNTAGDAEGRQAPGQPAPSAGPAIADAVVTGTWAWPALAAFGVPGIVFAIVMLAG